MVKVQTKKLPQDVEGMALLPFIFVKNLKDKCTIRHEEIHIRQQISLLVVFFYLIYFLEHIIYYIKYRDWDIAYRNISFEREAYDNQKNKKYKKFYGWIPYLFCLK